MTLPNQLTILRIALTPVFVTIFLWGDSPYFQLAAFGIFIAATLTDAYDGYIARKYGTVTRWGAFMDPLADKILMGAAFFSLWLKGYLQLWMILVIFSRDLLITAMRSYSMKKKKPLKTEKFAKWKTTAQMILVIGLMIYMNLKQSPWGVLLPQQWISYVENTNLVYSAMLFVTVLTAYSGLRYIFRNSRDVKKMAVWAYRSLLNSD